MCVRSASELPKRPDIKPPWADRRPHTLLTVKPSLAGVVLGFPQTRLRRAVQHLADGRHVRAGRRSVGVARVIRVAFVPGGKLRSRQAGRQARTRKHRGVYSLQSCLSSARGGQGLYLRLAVYSRQNSSSNNNVSVYSSSSHAKRAAPRKLHAIIYLCTLFFK